MNKNSMILACIGIIALFGLLTVVYLATNTTENKIYAETLKIDKTDHVKWSPSKKHILVEYGDLQCPGCANVYAYMKANVDNDQAITKNMTFVYRNFPLTIHSHSNEAAYAAEAAGKQGKYFEMADRLFTNQTSWSDLSAVDVDTYFKKTATDLKLDMDKFDKDRNSDEVKQKVSNDLNSGNNVAVNQTPSFYLDGKKVEINNLDQFKAQLLDTAKQEKMVK